MKILIIKAFISIFIVIGLVLISEKNPKIGGLLAGLPLGIGILMFFYALEQGTTFAIIGIPYAIAGLTGSLAFSIGFYIGGRLFLQNKMINTATSIFCAMLGFFISGFLISLINITLTMGIGIFLLGMILSLLLFTTVPENMEIEIQKYSFFTLVFRALFVTVIVLAFTSAAKIVGSKWAGIIASFPTMLCPVLIILAYNYKDAIYPTVLKHFSYSITSLLVYYLLILILYPKYGIYSGTIFAYLICFMFVYALNAMGKYKGTKTERGQP